MLPKKKRVDKKTFQILMKDGKILSSSFFLLYFINTEDPCYAFVAPKKYFRGAFKRNRYRRMGYNILKEIPLSKGTGVFVYKKESLLTQKGEIEKDLLFLLKKTRVLV